MKYNVTVNGKKFEVEVEKVTESKDRAKSPTKYAAVAPVEPAKTSYSAASSDEETVNSPMPGTITSIKVTEGQKVQKGQVLFILEAMKMENEIMAPRDAVVSKIVVTSGKPVKTGDALILLK